MNDPDVPADELSFGQQLRVLRRNKKYTLKEVEAMTGISNAYLSQAENGKITKPAPDKLYALADAYGVSFDQLMYSAGHLSRNPLIETQQHEPKTLMGAMLSSKNLTAAEEEQLALYLEFLRARK